VDVFNIMYVTTSCGLLGHMMQKGYNWILAGDTLLTADNPIERGNAALFRRLCLTALKPPAA
jgi:hypothetical protein